MSKKSLVPISEIQQAVDRVETIEEAVELHPKLEAVARYAKKIGLETVKVNIALGGLLKLERKTGGWLPAPMSRSEAARHSHGENAFHNVCKSKGLRKDRAKRWWLCAQVPDDDFDEYLEGCNEREEHATQGGLLKIAKTLQRHDRIRRRKRPLKGDRFELIIGDFREKTKDLKPASIDLVLTDPPYGKEYLPLYSDLVEVANRVLVGGGSCLVMIGTMFLPEMLEALSSGPLSYHWTLAYLMPGASTQVWPRKIKSNWKPVVWLVKGKNRSEQMTDVVWNKEPDRRFHKWGQSVQGMAEILERFTVQGETILDPFVGAGSTAIAAVQLKRYFFGIDKEKSCIEKTAERLATL